MRSAHASTCLFLVRCVSWSGAIATEDSEDSEQVKGCVVLERFDERGFLMVLKGHRKEVLRCFDDSSILAGMCRKTPLKYKAEYGRIRAASPTENMVP
jgi:hypothetical protein